MSIVSLIKHLIRSLLNRLNWLRKLLAYPDNNTLLVNLVIYINEYYKIYKNKKLRNNKNCFSSIILTHLLNSVDSVRDEPRTHRSVVGNLVFPSPHPIRPRAGIPCSHWLLIHLAKPVFVPLHQFKTLVYMTKSTTLFPLFAPVIF